MPIFSHSIPILWYDNLSTVSLVANPMLYTRIKHVELDMHFIQEKVLAKEFIVQYIPSHEQPANTLTKTPTIQAFLHIRSKLSVIQLPLSLRNTEFERW